MNSSEILKSFSKHLTEVKFPKEKTSWNIAGIIKGQNAFYKFDVRDMFKLPDGTPAQKGRIDTKADKMVLDLKDKWIILDIEELNKYLIDNKLNKVYTDILLKELEWNIVLDKNE